MGSDSAIMGEENDICISADAKVFRRGNVVFGFAGEFTTSDLLKYHVDIPELSGSVDRWLRRELVPQIRKAATEQDVDWSKGHALIGVAGRVFFIDDNYAVLEPMQQSPDGRKTEHYAAIGTGAAWAQGVLWGEDRDGGLTLQQQAEKALRCASIWCTEVRPPFRFVEV
jgi:ATP-dependent protease HslVU (ClpYQ) peptidase subunit